MVYKNTPHDFALVDNKLSHSQSAIGLSSNDAQFAQTYMNTYPNEKKYQDYVCILSVLAQVAIDSAKRAFDVDINAEIDRIEKDLNIKDNGYPLFWKCVKDKKGKVGDKPFDCSKINYELKCPMNYLAEYKFETFRSKESTLPMDYFFQKFAFDDTTIKRKSKKVEKLIQDYQMDLYSYNMNVEHDTDNTWDLLDMEIEELVDSIQEIYISSSYKALFSYLIDKAFKITPNGKRGNTLTDSVTDKNKSLLINVLYKVNKHNLFDVFSKNLQ